ncbi:DNA/RNA-binding protein KIN17 isoform X3 [Hippopotamus amphibius kiboko]|nr:DNA/RNA-binding protein KIN17 isoform X3 [Hippopotamus amphibius kiboko]
MNATQWETLTDFTKWLGREGLCKVDETPKGWYIQYIDRDPETIRRQLELEKKKKQDLDDEEKTAKFIQEQVRRGLEGKEQETPVFTELSRENDEEKVTFNLNKGACSSGAASSKSSSLGPSALKTIGNAASVKRKDSSQSSAQSKEKKKKKSALDEIMEIEEEKKRASRTDYWLQPEIIVKIITKKLGEKYHKKKGIVKEVIDKYTAVVKMIDSGDKLKLDQTHLETVIPAPGKRILVLNGGYRGNEGTLESINEKTFSATIVIETVSMFTQRQKFQNAFKMCRGVFSLDWYFKNFLFAFCPVWKSISLFSLMTDITKAFYFLITKEILCVSESVQAAVTKYHRLGWL